MAIVNPVMGLQIVDVNIENKRCLDIQCFNLPTVLQAIIDKLCDNTLPESYVSCIGTYNTLPDTLNAFATKICDIESRLESVEASDNTVSVNMCLSDNWDFNDNENCLGSANACGHDPAAVLQILISRVLAYQTKIIELNDKIISLETALNVQQSIINTIQSTCCP